MEDFKVLVCFRKIPVLLIVGLILLAYVLLGLKPHMRSNELLKSDVHVPVDPIVSRQNKRADGITKTASGDSNNEGHQRSVHSTLSQDVVSGVEKFVFFIGFTRSGHSIIGSFIDAHPHMIIAYQYKLFRRLSQLRVGDKAVLFNGLYRNSHLDAAKGWMSGGPTKKNYTLHVDYPWQGVYDDYISVIGDKAGGSTTLFFDSSPARFVDRYKNLKEIVQVPVKVIFVVRNPFDMIATHVLYHDSPKLREILEKTISSDKLTTQILASNDRIVSLYKSTMNDLQQSHQEELLLDAKYNDEHNLEVQINTIASLAGANEKLIDLITHDNVLEIHNEDLVDHPKSVMTAICDFLEVDCHSDYVQACANKVYRSVSRTRDFVVWPPRLQKMVEDGIIGKYQFFTKYSFESD